MDNDQVKPRTDEQKRGDLVTHLSQAAGGDPVPVRLNCNGDVFVIIGGDPVPVRLNCNGDVFVIIGGYEYYEGNIEKMIGYLK